MKKIVLVASLLLGLIIVWVTMLLVFVGNGIIINFIGIAGLFISLMVLVVPSQGLSGLKTYMGSLTRWKVGFRWYLIAALVPLSVGATALAVFSLRKGLSLPLNPEFWNLSYASLLLQKLLYVSLLAVAFAGFVLLRTSSKNSGLKKGLIFCISLFICLALIILAAMLSYGHNFWLFVGLIPAAFIGLWIYENSRKSLLLTGLFIYSFLASELLSPANWYLTGGFPEAMMIGAAIYLLIAVFLVVVDRKFFFSSPADEGIKMNPTTSGKIRLDLPIILSAIAVLAAIVSLIYIMSINSGMSYPDPSGPYPVGKSAYHWVDQSRSEIATGNATDRELMVYLWYPAEVTENMTEAPVMDIKTASAVRAGDAFSISFLKDLSDHTYTAAPLSTNLSQYPVLIMSHGDSSSPLLMAATATDLASHGYIVAGISHTYNSRGTVFPDWRVIARDFNYSLIQNDPYDLNLSYYENAKNWARHNADVELREAADVSFVLDQLEQLNQSDTRFMGKIDMSRVGTFGHSLGGAVAVTSAELDDRIKAAADLDGAVYHNTRIEKPTISFFRGSLLNYNRSYDALNQKLLTPEQFAEMKNIWDGYEIQVYTSPPTAYYVGIKGTEHANFKDFGTLGIPIDIGPIDGKYATRIIDAYLLAFFDKHLNGVDSPLLNGTQVYPEVVFKGHVDDVPVVG